jgi:hypothetical protein
MSTTHGTARIRHVRRSPISAIRPARANSVCSTSRPVGWSNGCGRYQCGRGVFVALHYPAYRHYDVLGGLKAMAELDLIRTPRCSDALDVLESRELQGGGCAADGRYFEPSPIVASVAHGADYVDWGGTSRKTPNEWITADALCVPHAAGRK